MRVSTGSEKHSRDSVAPTFTRTAGALSLALAALVAASSCQRSDDLVYLDELPVPATTQTSDEIAANEDAANVDAPIQETQPAEPVKAAVQIDEKGVNMTISGGTFLGFEDSDRARLSAVKVVRGEGTIAAKGLEDLASMKELVEFLWIDASFEDDDDATKNAFEKLALAPKLKKVRLNGLRNSAGNFPQYVLPALAKAANLVELDISGSKVTPELLKNAGWNDGFTKLQKLNLYQTNVSDNGVDAILPLAERLTWLNLDDVAITPAAAPKIALFKNLTFLHVGRSAIDDACIDELAKLNALTKIHVTRSAVTEEGAQKLREALPNCDVVSVPEN